MFLQETYEVYDEGVEFDTHDISMRFRDGTAFIANVYECGELVTRKDIDYSDMGGSDTTTLLFKLNNVYFSRVYNPANNGVRLNITLQAGDYTITTYYKSIHGNIYSTTNTIHIDP